MDENGGYIIAGGSDSDVPSVLFTQEGVTSAARIEAGIEMLIYNCRFLTLMAIVGSLAGSLICFIKGSTFIYHAFADYYNTCLQGQLKGKVMVHLIQAVDMYLVGTVMLILGMGLYGLFITNANVNALPHEDRALKNSTLFGMFRLSERPRWMKMQSLSDLKSKLGHVIVMVLLVSMFDKAKQIPIGTGIELLWFAGSVALSAVTLYILHCMSSTE